MTKSEMHQFAQRERISREIITKFSLKCKALQRENFSLLTELTMTKRKLQALKEAN